jgi:hypothetical protein
MAALRRRSSTWLGAAGIVQAAAIALLPKCPACAAVDAGVLGSFLAFVRLRIPQPAFLYVILGVAGAIALGSRSWKRNAAPSAPAQPERADGVDCCASARVS